MQLSAVEDIAAPIEQVFEQLTEFDAIERQALRRGVDVRRQFVGDSPKNGEGWSARFRFRGKDREAKITVAEIDAPTFLRFFGISGGLETNTDIELVALSRSRTRVNVTVQFVPKTLSARLLVQSFKLARGTLSKRFRVRMAEFAKHIETRQAGFA